MTPTGSTLSRRILARQLRELREKAGVTAEFARTAIGVGKQTLWRMETGQPVRFNPLFVERLCQVYGARDDVTGMLLALTGETQRTGWWQAYGDIVPKHFALFLGLEEAARRTISYHATLVPGLLQISEYHRALLEAGAPNMSAAEIERRIELLDRRKFRLTTPERLLRIEVIVDEGSLRHPIGGRAVMSAQLRHLAQVGHLRNVSIRVIPLDSAAYGGLTAGAFVILEFPTHPTAHLTEPPIVYLDGHLDAQYLDKADDVRHYQQIYDDLRRAALDEPRSRALIESIVAEYTN
ncbi:helix-turn-helix domain-containing protein [Nocardia brasiliensis]|uniref:Helix-turn-helix domain-containing protein n=1 Tax=Nocardia brasiliensis TaxID=37326 RepID=A0A6G9XNU8_NOCBR|nr:helix-turn-helix transcriptional regulator [Nocardia brasiliensis]QIS02520.1 helix-turn-helix domain-containing protein [Nocardia brasiliensis]